LAKVSQDKLLDTLKVFQDKVSPQKTTLDKVFLLVLVLTSTLIQASLVLVLDLADTAKLNHNSLLTLV